ncbi:hypothetical protein MHBO_002618 [Bonamia ostreae]|uniref:Uncharacterized protein n=1 Tax=Bonamia ostreae TaxID=126728 RepID=A0ABV2ANI8_9EUKA
MSSAEDVLAKTNLILTRTDDAKYKLSYNVLLENFRNLNGNGTFNYNFEPSLEDAKFFEKDSMQETTTVGENKLYILRINIKNTLFVKVFNFGTIQDSTIDLDPTKNGGGRLEKKIEYANEFLSVDDAGSLVLRDRTQKIKFICSRTTVLELEPNTDCLKIDFSVNADDEDGKGFKIKN